MYERNKVDSTEGYGLVARALSQNMAPIPASPANPADDPAFWAFQTSFPTIPRVFGLNLIENRDDFGRQISLESNPNRYDFENSKENTPQFYRDLAKNIFIESGKKVDLTPETLMYLVNQSGGFGASINRYLKMEVMRQKGIEVGEGPLAVIKQTLLAPFVNRDELNAGFRNWMDLRKNLAEYQRAANSPSLGGQLIDPKVKALGDLSKKLDSEHTILRNRIRNAKTEEEKIAAQKAIEAWYRSAISRYNLIAPEGKKIFVADKNRKTQ
jgi:hypothetical protein